MGGVCTADEGQRRFVSVLHGQSGHENKCLESENLNLRMSDKSGYMDYKVQNSVNKFKDEDRYEERLDFERSSAEQLAIRQKLVRVGN